MQRTADRDDVERTDIGRKRFCLAFDQRERLPRAHGRLSRGLDHRGFWIDADDTANVGRKAEREQPGAGAQIDQGASFGEAELLRDVAKEHARVGRPQVLIS